MKPVFVFDGKPPEMKSKELAKRKEGRDAADADLATAKEVCACPHPLPAHVACISFKAVGVAEPLRYISSAAARALLFREATACFEALTRCQDCVRQAGDAEAVEKASKKTVKVTRQHNEDCRKLLTLLGVPVIEVSRADHTPARPLLSCARRFLARLVCG